MSASALSHGNIAFTSICVLVSYQWSCYATCTPAVTGRVLWVGLPESRGFSSPPMPVIPIPRRVRSFHGPHTTCMHSACGPARTAQLVRTKYNNFDLYLKSRWMYSFIRFLLYFGCSLFTSLLWVALSALFCLQYVSVRIFLRLQYKLSVILLLLGHHRLDFGILNDLFIYSMHVTMFLIGGLGWCFMVFVDMWSSDWLNDHCVERHTIWFAFWACNFYTSWQNWEHMCDTLKKSWNTFPQLASHSSVRKMLWVCMFLIFLDFILIKCVVF